MAIVPVHIHGKEYQVACDDGQEQQLQFLAAAVNERMRILLRGMHNHPGEAMGLLLVSLMLADELIESKKEIEGVVTEVQRLGALVSDGQESAYIDRRVEIENAMASTLEEIAMRIERIADRIEVR